MNVSLGDSTRWLASPAFSGDRDTLTQERIPIAKVVEELVAAGKPPSEILLRFRASDPFADPEDDRERRDHRKHHSDVARARRAISSAPSGSSSISKSRAERETTNFPIQGMAADILKRAMIDLHDELPRQGLSARMILTVHDELLFEAPREEADAAAAVIGRKMEHAVELSVPLTVDVGIGDNWRDAKS